jgi:hypothetical protein
MVQIPAPAVHIADREGHRFESAVHQFDSLVRIAGRLASIIAGASHIPDGPLRISARALHQPA